MIRLVADSGGMIHGGLAQVGRRRRDLRDALRHELARPQLVRARA